MSREIRPFNIMAKPVCGVCNLACEYCYYLDTPRRLYPDVRKFQMSHEVLASYVSQYISAAPKRVDFNWQGGEPLLCGIDFFKKAVELQGRGRRDSQEIINALQTNGVALDDEWCEFFATNNFLIGISIDGPPQWHDAYRRDKAGTGSFARAWAGLELLKKHGVDFNVLVTLNAANASHGADIYRYFVNRGVRYLQFIPILERDEHGNVRDFSCPPDQFGKLLLEVFELWASRDAARVSERFIDNVIHTLLYGQASICCYAERCANAFVLEFNGDLYACDHFVTRQWLIGNIMDRPLGQLLADEKLEQFAHLKTDLPAACKDCQFLRFCNGGCPKHHVPIGTDPHRVNYFCDAYKLFFREALEPLKEISEHIRRDGALAPKSAGQTRPVSGRSAAAGPAYATEAPPGRIGRNDPCPCGSGRKFKNCCSRVS